MNTFLQVLFFINLVFSPKCVSDIIRGPFREKPGSKLSKVREVIFFAGA